MLLSVLEENDLESVQAGFAFVPNQNYLLQKAELRPQYDALEAELREVCADGDRLAKFWDEVRTELEQGKVDEERGRRNEPQRPDLRASFSTISAL